MYLLLSVKNQRTPPNPKPNKLDIHNRDTKVNAERIRTGQATD